MSKRHRKQHEPAGPAPSRSWPPSDVSSPWPGLLIGGMLGVISLPLVWVFVNRLLDPGPRDELGDTLIQLAIALGFAGLTWGCAFARHRVAVDGAARTVTWTKSLFGIIWRRETWTKPDMTAITVARAGRFGNLRMIYLDGTRGRRPLRDGAGSDADAGPWAEALGVPLVDVPPAPEFKPTGPLSTPQLIGWSALVAAAFPALMWYRAGPTAVGYGFGFSGFLILLMLAIHFFADRDTSQVETPKLAPGRFDWLGVVWLLSVPFGPFLGWSATEQLDHDNWRLLSGIRVFLSVVLPLVGALALLRWVRGRHARTAALVLLIGTAFPLLTAMGATLDFLRGPIWREVTVTLAYHPKSKWGKLPIQFVELDDGRTLRGVEGVEARNGRARLLLLEGLDRVLEVAR